MSVRRHAAVPPLFVAAFGAADGSVSLGLRAAAVAFVTVLTAVAAQVSVPLPFTPVPFTLQPVVVLVGGALLGPRLGLLSQVVYLGAGAVGLPVFAASAALPQGPARLFGPTGGYLLSYPLAAWLTGWMARRGFDRRYFTSVIAMLAGLTAIFAGGVLWLSAFTPAAAGRLNTALHLGLYPFLLADILKVCLAGLVLPTLWRFLGLDGRGGTGVLEDQKILKR
jgi:biotin transport system substrate-specific component